MNIYPIILFDLNIYIYIYYILYIYNVYLLYIYYDIYIHIVYIYYIYVYIHYGMEKIKLNSYCYSEFHT